MTIEFLADAEKEFYKLDKSVRSQIEKYLTKLQELDNPRLKEEQLKGNLASFWRCRVGNYRLICSIDDDKMLIIVLHIGHRSKIYKDKN